MLTLAFAAVVLTGATSTRSAKFDTIDVQRINVREADGTLRLVVSNNGRMPGGIFHGKEYPHPHQGERGAGLMFYNDEGSETGGLTFRGAKGPDGKGRGSVHMSFDQYEQDQTLVLEQADGDGKHRAGMKILDRPEESLVGIMSEYARISSLPAQERERRWKEVVAGQTKNYQGGPRLFVGKDETRAAVLDLKDVDNRTRLRLRVEADGEARIEFLDADGKVQRTLGPGDLQQQ
ncbi:hypothetical protein GCM10022229_13130 [Luteimonas lutimaris]|uniref:DUF3471 domain-containing protein n=1 Tax=Luteimonas lutimaris TaxID=698645 RepID=A0ABP7MDG1_9GAMM